MIEHLDKLIIEDSLSLDKLNAYLEQPNYFEILGISTKELQHSNFLAWIFDPNGSHKAKDYFLKSFLNKLDINSNNKIKLNISDLSNTIILREYENIDLLIVNEEIGFTICIENKIYAGKSGDDQLIRYYNIVENKWSEAEHLKAYIYLTPTPRVLTQEEDINYQNITYASILEILEGTLESIDVAEYSIELINNYINNLRKNIMTDSTEILLAQEIYNKHRKAIDFIIKNKPSLYSKELFDSINHYFIEHSNYINLTPCDKNIIRILPRGISNIFELGSNSWPETNSIFAIELFCERERVLAKLCFGGIWHKPEDERSLLQIKKDVLFTEMKSFDSIKSFIVSKSRSSSNYPAVAFIEIIDLNHKYISESENNFNAFIKAFNDFEDNILNNWNNEVIDKLENILIEKSN